MTSVIIIYLHENLIIFEETKFTQVVKIELKVETLELITYDRRGNFVDFSKFGRQTITFIKILVISFFNISDLILLINLTTNFVSDFFFVVPSSSCKD